MNCLCCPVEKAQLELTETLCATSLSVGTSVVTEAPLGFGELADDDCHVATEAVGSDTVEAFGRDPVESVWNNRQELQLSRKRRSVT